MTLAEFVYMRKRFRLTGQQGAFLASLLDAPDGYVSRADMEAALRMAGAHPPECISSASDILKVVMCRVNQRLPERFRVSLDRPPRKGHAGSTRATGYRLSQEGRAYVLKAISEIARADDARNVRLAGAHL